MTRRPLLLTGCLVLFTADDLALADCLETAVNFLHGVLVARNRGVRHRFADLPAGVEGEEERVVAFFDTNHHALAEHVSEGGETGGREVEPALGIGIRCQMPRPWNVVGSDFLQVRLGGTEQFENSLVIHSE